MFSANATNPAPFKERYRYRIDRFYKIWFSKQPDAFLGLENELRFIRMRVNNPHATLTLIFSSVCLSQKAQQDLRSFCRTHRIRPVDFDTDIPKMVMNSQDQTMYQLAKDEINRTLNNQHGNLAAASDCTRLITPVIKTFGIYTDFDIECRLEQLNADIIDIRSPVLLNSELLLIDTSTVSVSANTDFLAFTEDEDADIIIKAVQKTIIEQYQSPITMNQLLGTEKTNFEKRIPIRDIFTRFSQQYPNHPTVFEFREFLTNGNIQQEHRDYLIKLTVIAISGPTCYAEMFAVLKPQTSERSPLHLSTRDPHWKPFLDMHRKSSIFFYEPISNCLIGMNNFDVLMQNKSSANDLSWTHLGECKKQQRESFMRHSGKLIWRFWKKHQSPHELLSSRLNQLNAPQAIIESVANHEYARALRQAASALNLPVIELLFRYADRLPIDLNQTSSNGYTALDWAMHAKSKNSAQKNAVIELLKHKMTESNYRPRQIKA